MTIDVFPLAGGARYRDDFGEPRGTPEKPRTHEGNDLFVVNGTAVLAPADGVVGYYTDGIGGPSFVMRFDDGSRAYGTHLSAYAFGVAIGQDTRNDRQRVRKGDLIGYSGHGGNAAGTPPHLHFQYWLPSGQLVDPYAYLRAAQVMNAPTPPAPMAASSSSSGGAAALAAFAVVAFFSAAAIVVHKTKVERAHA